MWTFKIKRKIDFALGNANDPNYVIENEVNKEITVTTPCGDFNWEKPTPTEYLGEESVFVDTLENIKFKAPKTLEKDSAGDSWSSVCSGVALITL